MSPLLSSDQGSRLEEFTRKHRAELVTILFTDIVGSTALKQQLGEHEAVALIQRHHALVREVLARFPEAEEIETAGDSFLLVFDRPSEAVKYSLILQTRLGDLAQETDRAAPNVVRLGEQRTPRQFRVKQPWGIIQM